MNTKTMKKAGLLLMSLALISTTLWAESPEKKGLDVINRSTAEAHIGFLANDDLEGRGGPVSVEVV